MPRSAMSVMGGTEFSVYLINIKEKPQEIETNTRASKLEIITMQSHVIETRFNELTLILVYFMKPVLVD